MLRLFSRFIERRPLLMAVGEAVGMGLQGIRAYKMRAFLTILGVVMGIMTVTGMSSIVAGLNASMAKQIATLGSSTIFIRPQAPGENLDDDEWRRRKGLTMDEVDMIAAKPAVKAIAPLQFIPIENVKYGTERAREAQVLGTTAAYEEVHDSYVEKGRFLSATDVDRAAHVVVLGVDIADALFPFIEPVDKVINLDGRPFTVIGVLQRKGKFLFRSMDNIVLVPVNSIQKQDRRFNFMMADIKPVSPGHIEAAVDQTREAMRRYRKLKYLQKDNFGIFGQDTLTDLYRQITGGIYMVMIAISSIGLLVGGVGVMNIMLVSVTERTREIGVRKALGATKRDILWQFLTEAMTLTGAGGIIGILIGAILAFLINTFSPFPAVIQPTWVILAFSTSDGRGPHLRPLARGQGRAPRPDRSAPVRIAALSFRGAPSVPCAEGSCRYSDSPVRRSAMSDPLPPQVPSPAPIAPEKPGGFFQNLIDVYFALARPSPGSCATPPSSSRSRRTSSWSSASPASGCTRWTPGEFMKTQLEESGAVPTGSRPSSARRVIEQQAKLDADLRLGAGPDRRHRGHAAGRSPAVLMFVFRFFYASEVVFKQAFAIVTSDLLRGGPGHDAAAAARCLAAEGRLEHQPPGRHPGQPRPAARQVHRRRSRSGRCSPASTSSRSGRSSCSRSGSGSPARRRRARLSGASPIPWVVIVLVQGGLGRDLLSRPRSFMAGGRLPVGPGRAYSFRLHRAPLAQLDRATDYESVGRAFESPRAHHPSTTCGRRPLRGAEVATDLLPAARRA